METCLHSSLSPLLQASMCSPPESLYSPVVSINCFLNCVQLLQLFSVQGWGGLVQGLSPLVPEAETCPRKPPVVVFLLPCLPSLISFLCQFLPCPNIGVSTNLSFLSTSTFQIRGQAKSMPSHLCIACVCFWAITAELSSYNRDLTAHRA